MAVTGLIVAGCSSDPTDTATRSGQGDSEQSPLAEYLGFSPLTTGLGLMTFGAGGEGDDSWEPSEEDRQNVQRVEQLIAECMRDEGFDYVPRSLDDHESGIVDEAFSLEPQEFVQQYGYGISTLTFGGEDDENEDPNEEIRKALSDSAREAYDSALWGELQSLPELEGDAEPDELVIDPEDLVIDPEDMGCEGKAAAEVYGEAGEVIEIEDENEFKELFDDIEALQERIQRDPRIVGATESWAQCMAENGYSDFNDPEEAQNSVDDRMMSLRGESEVAGESASAGVVIPEIDETVDPEQLKDLQEYEIGVATADFACQQEHYQEIHDEVAFEMEQEFVSAHRAELERYRDSGAAGGGGGH